MKIVDANVLLYAVNSAAEHHVACRRWLDRALSGADGVGLAWVPLLAFARLATKEGLFPRPMRPEDATAQIVDWLAAPGAVPVGPSPRHAEVLSRLLAEKGGRWQPRQRRTSGRAGDRTPREHRVLRQRFRTIPRCPVGSPGHAGVTARSLPRVCSWIRPKRRVAGETARSVWPQAVGVAG